MAVVPVPAATLIIVRDSARGPEVLLQQRSRESRFVAGAWVFPGGRVDPDDHDPRWLSLCRGIDNAFANRQLGLDEGALAYWVAALRESFEEAGVLAAESSTPLTGHHLDAWRAQLTRGETHFLNLCLEHGLRLATDSVRYVNHWVTPPALPIRYDCRFFVTRLPDGQEPDHRHFEAVDTLWITPAEALERERAGTMELILPTFVSLQVMAGHADCDTLIDALAQPLRQGAPT